MFSCEKLEDVIFSLKILDSIQEIENHEGHGGHGEIGNGVGRGAREFIALYALSLPRELRAPRGSSEFLFLNLYSSRLLRSLAMSRCGGAPNSFL